MSGNTADQMEEGQDASPLQAAVDTFYGGLSSFRNVLDSISAGMEEERQALQQERQTLDRRRKEFEDEQAVVAQVAVSASEQVTLNVGGFKFTTTVSTLRNAPAPSLFNAMFSGRHTVQPDESGCIFLDRDGRHFHDILNFLRDGSFSYPADGADFKYLLELRAEAEYYCLAALVEQIDRYPYSLTRVQRCVGVNTAEAWIYSDADSPDEIVVSVSAPCQLLGVGLCGTVGAINVALTVSEVDGEDFGWAVARLGGAAQSFTKADAHRLLLPRPVPLQPGAFYMLSADIQGAQSSCCEQCLDSVVAGGVCVTFHPWESANGTTESRGQFLELYIRGRAAHAQAASPLSPL